MAGQSVAQTKPLAVSTATLTAMEAWQQALEHRYFRVLAGAVLCRMCGESFGLACSPALTAGHLQVVHGIEDLHA